MFLYTFSSPRANVRNTMNPSKIKLNITEKAYVIITYETAGPHTPSRTTSYEPTVPPHPLHVRVRNLWMVPNGQLTLQYRIGNINFISRLHVLRMHIPIAPRQYTT